MDWDDLRHFAALAEAGSLSAAARRLGIEHATVARRILSLERTLAVPLVDRRGRRWTLTEAGLRLAAIAARMEGEAQAARRLADATRTDLQGTVTVSAPPALEAAILAAPLVGLQARHPGLTIRMVGEARTASLDRGEADVAIRLTRPESGDLTITRLGRIGFRLYASPGYLAACLPAEWRFIGYDGTPAPPPQQAALEAFAAGRPMAFMASSLEIQQAAARAGGGIAVLPDFLGRADAGLIAVPPDRPIIEREVWFVAHSDLMRSGPVRAVLACLRAAPALFAAVPG